MSSLNTVPEIIAEKNSGFGKPLFVKSGWNPNSSSIGSDTIALFTTAAAAATVLSSTAAFIMARVKMNAEIQTVAKESHAAESRSVQSSR